MADFIDNRSGSRKSSKKAGQGHSNGEDGIIELSDMAVGISSEDEPIIDLTEDLVNEAIRGYSGASGEMGAGDERLELSDQKGRSADSNTESPGTAPVAEPGGDADVAALSGTDSIEAIEADIAKELDNYFQLEEETQQLLNGRADEPIAQSVGTSENPQPAEADVKVTPDQFEAALERVIRRMYGEKIDHILQEVVERTVSDEVGELKDYLMKKTLKKE
ncbi:MAG: hypothetical protein ACQERN_03690 [Thermodesulfobacteriota bacterium]